MDLAGCSLEQFCTSIDPNSFDSITQGVKACEVADFQNTGTRDCEAVRISRRPLVYECVPH